MNHPIVSQEEWIAARKKLLVREKELTHLREELSRELRALPWVKVEKPYVFEGPRGKLSFAELFDGRSQLILQHFMLGPGWKQGCVGCSFQADHVDGALVHLEHHDVSFVAVSRGTFPEIDAYKRRMGWRFNWVSSFGSDLNYDFHVSFRKDELECGKACYNYELRDVRIEELHGTSVFYKDDAGSVFHSYSSYARGCETLIGAYHYLDLTPKGRNETGPNHNLTDWVRHHDLYESAARG